MSEKGNIPTADDFERASRLMKAQFRNLEQVREAVLTRFRAVAPLHAFHILPQRDVDFRAYVFFEKDKDIEACDSSGISQQIVDCVYDELERAGRGSRADIKVAFEFDSHENVVANYERNYFLRLR